MSDVWQNITDALPGAARAALTVSEAGRQVLDLQQRKRQQDFENSFRQSVQNHVEAQDAAAEAERQFHNHLDLINAGAQPVANGAFSRSVDMPTMSYNADLSPKMNPDGSVPTHPEQAQVGVSPTDNVLSAAGQQFRVPSQQERSQTDLNDRVKRAGALGEMVPLPAALRDKLFPDGDGPKSVNPAALQGLQQSYQDVTTREEAIAAKKAKDEADALANQNPPAKPPKTTITLTPQDAKALGLPAGTEVPKDEYDSRVKMLTAASEATKRAAGSGGATAPPTAGQLAVAKKVASGDLSIQRLTRLPDKEAILAAAYDINPDLTDNTAATKKAFTDPASRQSQNLGTIARIVGHIDQFEKNSEDLGWGPAYAYGGRLPGSPATRVASDTNAIAGELEKLVSGGVATVQQTREWKAGLNSQFAGVRSDTIDQISKLVGSQYEAMNQTYRAGIGEDLPIDKYVSPQGKAWMVKHGINIGDAAGSQAPRPPAAGGQGGGRGAPKSPADASGGLPVVGSTFNGGKVLKVEKVQ